ncbi:unnamed protein product [Darwinula stevensoni]|uniref:Uncharacterized protein n=1 Tax=Darwinula stevensoni TaxID=69355 RepID=A0A7R8X201_9CRUS|nr:unnamed protein product [Darwinula stevensoni]CAG0880911.1 unnamed protein product [Darwinula stevensoni]
MKYLGQNRYGELLDLLYEGATTLLTHNQQHSGTDLSVLFIEVLEKSQQGVSEEILMKLGR